MVLGHKRVHREGEENLAQVALQNALDEKESTNFPGRSTELLENEVVPVGQIPTGPVWNQFALQDLANSKQLVSP